MNRSPIIQVFAKYPYPGRVKTRLAKSIGDESAAQVHRELVERQLQCLQQLPAFIRLELWCDEDADAPYYQALFQRWPRLSYRRQSAGNLGARLGNALRRGLWFSPKVLQIGTDCPFLNPQVIGVALSSLCPQTDIVFVPAEDGGYVLGGYTTFRATLFDNIEWSTDQVLVQSLRRAESVGLCSICLPSLWDIDRLEDLERYRQWQNTGLSKE